MLIDQPVEFSALILQRAHLGLQLVLLSCDVATGARRFARGREEAPVLTLNERHELVLVLGRFSRLVQRPPERADMGEVGLDERLALLDLQGHQQIQVQGLLEDGQEPVVGRISGRLLRAGRRDVQLGLGSLQPSFAVDEVVGAGGQGQGDLGADVASDGLDGLHVAVRSGGLEVADQVDRLGDRSLAGLVGSLDNGHAIPELDGGIGDAAEVDHSHLADPHDALPVATSR